MNSGEMKLAELMLDESAWDGENRLGKLLIDLRTSMNNYIFIC